MERRGNIRGVPAGGDAARVPPHDLDAERAVIGAMLVSETAVASVAEQLAAEDFYSETNRIIYASMMRLYSRGERIDQITLTSDLNSVGEFEKVGGRRYIFDIVESVPTASNASRYAEIVRGKALLRAVIDAGSRITEDAFREPDDVGDALDSAEQMIYNISNRSLKDHLSPVSELAPGALEMIQNLYESDGEVTGVETGFEDLDRLTTGFHKSDLVVLAARPAMGKTAFALNAIWHAAGEKKAPVAIFSLEMSKEQLVQRLISQTTRIPTQDLRSGNVKAEDWPKLLRGVAQVSEAPIWIDDTAGVSLMEMRAKTRRLSSQLKARDETPLSLVVVDYLQLMVGQGRIESRQQEIAEISRGLKVLARDLDVPVLAIAQLSRAVEQRHDKRPLLSDLRDCVTGDTLVVLADGRRVPVRDLVGETPSVLAMSPEGRIIEAKSERIWSVGRRPVFTVKLASGREVRATANHRIFGADGWIKVGSLAEGDRLAIARRLPEPQEVEEWSDERVALLGQLIGDGSYLKGQPLRYTTACEENSRLVSEAAEAGFGVKVSRYPGRGNWHQLVFSGNGNRWRPAGLNLWLRDLGIFDQRSFEKRVPEAAFRLSNRQIAVLLKHLWATDGTIFARKPGVRGSSTICFSTSSRGLAEDVLALLLRLGIVGRIREIPQGRHRPMFNAVVSGAENQRRFLELVGAFGIRRTEAANRIARSLEGKVSVTNVDTLPVEFFGQVKASMAARGVSHRAMSVARGTSYGGSSRFRFAPSRTLVSEYADLLDGDSLRSLATSDLFWDRVVEVVPSGEEEVFDLTVPGPASWLANGGVVSHNSGAIEQDADMVMFLYRDEYYNPDSDDKGIAEVIVGKHRNGPTGKTQLAWLEQYTKFASLARRRD